jgi:hypothetical protein
MGVHDDAVERVFTMDWRTQHYAEIRADLKQRFLAR